jgi:hypothetical protein
VKFLDYNQYHEPGGTPKGGQFARKPGGPDDEHAMEREVRLLHEPSGLQGDPTQLRYKFAAVGIEADDASVELYKKYMGKISPEEFKNAMLGGHFLDSKLRMDNYKFAPGSFTLHGNIGEDEGYLSRTFNFINKIVSHGELTLQRDLRGKGMSKDILRNQMALYKKIGIDRISMSAVEIGSYAWTKYGFTPLQPSWDSLRADLKSRTRSLSGILPEEVSGSVMKILESPDPKAIWALSDVTWKLPDSGEPLGKHLLLGQRYGISWWGGISLSDATAMKRFKAYAG